MCQSWALHDFISKYINIYRMEATTIDNVLHFFQYTTHTCFEQLIQIIATSWEFTTESQSVEFCRANIIKPVKDIVGTFF